MEENKYDLRKDRNVSWLVAFGLAYDSPRTWKEPQKEAWAMHRPLASMAKVRRGLGTRGEKRRKSMEPTQVARSGLCYGQLEYFLIDYIPMKKGELE